METMEAQMLNEEYLKMLPRFDLSTINVGDFVILKRYSNGVYGDGPRQVRASAAVQVTAVREDELLVRVVEVLGGDRYFGIHRCDYTPGDSITLNPKEVHDRSVEIWPAKAVIPGT